MELERKYERTAHFERCPSEVPRGTGIGGIGAKQDFACLHVGVK